MATSLIKLRQLDQTELSGYIQQFVAGSITSSGFAANSTIFPNSSGAYNLGNASNFWKTVYANQLNLPSGSGVFFGSQYFTTSGNSLLISGAGGVTAISSTTSYVTYVGPQGAIGPTGLSGAKITGVVADGSNKIYFLLNDGSNTSGTLIQLPSGAVGATGSIGPSGASVTGSITGVDTTGQYFEFLYSNSTTGAKIYVPSGVQGADGEVGGVTLNFADLTGLFSGQYVPSVTVDGIANGYPFGGPDINLIKGFSYKFDFENINTLVYNNATQGIVDKPTNFIAYGSNDTGKYSKYTDGAGFLNGNGDALTSISNSGALLLAFFNSNTPTGRYIWKEDPAGSIGIVSSGYLVNPTGIFEDYSYQYDTITVGATGYNFYWRTKGAIRFADSVASTYKYGFALYNADTVVDPPVLQDSGAFYVLGTLNLSYAPLAGPIGPEGPQGIPGAQGLVGFSGARGATGVGVAGVNTVISTGGILTGFQIVLTDGQSVGPYMIPTGGPTGPAGPTGPSGLSVTGVTQLSTTGINFNLSNGSNTNPVYLPIGPTGTQGPAGTAEKYYSYFDPQVLRITGSSTLTGFQTGVTTGTLINATGSFRAPLVTGSYVKIYGSPNFPFAGCSYSSSQNLIVAKRGDPDAYFGAQVVSFDGSDLTFRVNSTVLPWTYAGLSILAANGSTIDVNLGNINYYGPTGVSVTGVSGYLNAGEATGVQFLFSDASSSSVFALPKGPKGDSGAAQAFRISGYTFNSDTSQLLTGNYGSADFLDYNITGGRSISYYMHSGTVTTGQVAMLLVRNSGFTGTVETAFTFTPDNQFYFVNDINPIFPRTSMAFNLYTFIRGKDYNNHPVYYCTYAANYPALT